MRTIGLAKTRQGLRKPIELCTATAGIEGLSVTLLYVLTTCVFFWPWVSHLSTWLPGPPEDNFSEFWASWYAVVGADPHHFFQTDLLRFPEGVSLIANFSGYPQMFFVWLLAKCGGGSHEQLVLYQNLALMLSFPVSGVGAYYLVRHFVDSKLAAAVGGYIFAFNPSHVAHAMHHLSVSTIEFLPIFALCYLLALERKSYVWLAWAAILLALNALTFWYYLFYPAFFVLFHTLYRCVKDDKLPVGWNLIVPMATLVGGTILLLPVLLPMIHEATQVKQLHIKGGNIYVADMLSFFVFPTTHFLSGWAETLNNRFSGNAWEATAYLGIVNMALIVWAYCEGRTWPRAPLGYAAAGMAVTMVLALGNSPHIGGIDYLFLHLPYNAIASLPFLGIMRSPSRIVVLTYLFLAIGVGYALAQVLRNERVYPKLIAAGLAILIVVDFYPRNLTASPAGCDGASRLIARDAEPGFGVLNLPRNAEVIKSALLQQTCHGKPIVFAALPLPSKRSLMDRLKTNNLDAQRQQLQQAKVKYVVLDLKTPWDTSDGVRADYFRAYDPIYVSGTQAVLRVDGAAKTP